MPDISMCSNVSCKQVNQCKRHKSSGTEPHPYRQSYSTFKPNESGQCDYFIYKEGSVASQQQRSKTPPSARDSWQTPQWLFDWADQRYGFEIDLACTKENSKCHSYISGKDMDSLQADWARLFSDLGFGWCNPPYSETGKWLAKAWVEAQLGFKSVFLVPTPNGENYYRDHVFGKASKIIYINGRVAFEKPMGNGKTKPVAGNTRGSCFIVYDEKYAGHTSISWVDRDEIKGVLS